jgi:hypothetical protein
VWRAHPAHYAQHAGGDSRGHGWHAASRHGRDPVRGAPGQPRAARHGQGRGGGTERHSPRIPGGAAARPARGARIGTHPRFSTAVDRAACPAEEACARCARIPQECSACCTAEPGQRLRVLSGTLRLELASRAMLMPGT